MPQQFLHGPDVIVRLQQVRCKRMAKSVDYHMVAIIPWVEKAEKKLFNVDVTLGRVGAKLIQTQLIYCHSQIRDSETSSE